MTAATASALTKIEQLGLDLCREFPHLCGDHVHELIESRANELLRHAHFDDFVPLLAYRYVRDGIRDEVGAAS